MMTEYTMYEAFRQAANKVPHDLAIYYEGKSVLKLILLPS